MEVSEDSSLLLSFDMRPLEIIKIDASPVLAHLKSNGLPISAFF